MLDRLLDRDVVFFGGKGGVGKTTCSAAFALAASRARTARAARVDRPGALDRRYLRASHRAMPSASCCRVCRAIEIDAGSEAARYIARRQARHRADVQPGRDSAGAPADRHGRRLARSRRGGAPRSDDRPDREPIASGAYDLIVFDTAPTGHTLQLLRMPDAMTTWIQALVKHRRALLEIDSGGGEQPAPLDADPVLTALERRHQRLVTLRDRVTDRARTSFALVTIPERLAIEETARAAELLSDTGVDVGALIVNRILPDGLTGEFYTTRKAQEGVYLHEIGARFPRLARTDVVQLARDVHGLDALTTISGQLVA